MPWQSAIADIALEMELDQNTGLLVPAYREVNILVPRQCGKTTLMLSMELHRALLWGKPQTIGYTAQTGWDARRKLIDDQVPAIEMSPLNA
ncbi:hypothetical protein UFOVP287_36, partial [uncultured Caudovirales phage]